ADRRRSQDLPDVALHRRRMDGGPGRHEGAMTWTRALAAVAAVLLAFGAAGAHQGGTTGHATISVAGQAVRYALSLPAEGLGDATRDLRELASAVARHVTIEGDGAACSAVPAETKAPPGRPARGGGGG